MELLNHVAMGFGVDSREGFEDMRAPVRGLS